MKNKKKIALIIFILLMILFTLFMVFLANEDLERYEEFEKMCDKVQGNLQRDFIHGECFDYDENGFIYYWAIDDNGRYYKWRR